MATATLSLQNNNSIYSSFHTSGTYNPGSGVDLSPTITAASITQDATSATAPSQFPSLHASFNYYLPPADGSRPPATYIDKPETYQQIAETRVMPVQDIRGNEDRYNLDTTGFQVVKHVSAEREFLDEDQIKRVYYPEVEAILKAATGASKIFIFDHTIRSSAQNQSSDKNSGKSVSLRGPVQRVHVDQSDKAARNRVTYHLPQEAERLLKGRFQIINLWRPIKTVRKDPLGIVDASSVPDSDLVPIELIYPDRVGETLAVRPNENHRWFYLKEQQPNEVMLIKCFDSKTDGRARRVPHSAFVDESTAHEEARESIEVRTLVFHPDDTD